MPVVYTHAPSGETFYGSHGLAEHLETNIFTDAGEDEAAEGVESAIAYLNDIEVSEQTDEASTDDTSRREERQE